MIGVHEKIHSRAWLYTAMQGKMEKERKNTENRREIKQGGLGLGMVVLAYNPCSWEPEAGRAL